MFSISKKDGLVLGIYDSEKAYFGTTLLTETHLVNRVIEVNMLGEIIWEYLKMVTCLKAIAILKDFMKGSAANS